MRRSRECAELLASSWHEQHPVVVEKQPALAQESCDERALSCPRRTQEEVCAAARTNRSGRMQHQISPQRHNTRQDVMEEQMEQEIWVAALVSDQGDFG